MSKTVNTSRADSPSLHLHLAPEYLQSNPETYLDQNSIISHHHSLSSFISPTLSSTSYDSMVKNSFATISSPCQVVPSYNLNINGDINDAYESGAIIGEDASLSCYSPGYNIGDGFDTFMYDGLSN